jgi:hypothetical protein
MILVSLFFGLVQSFLIRAHLYEHKTVGKVYSIMVTTERIS